MATNTRKRNWNLVINNYTNDDINNIVHSEKYAYIVHDEDTPHLHVVLMFKDAKTFTTIKKIFPSAHIEPVLDLNKSIQYLTHKNDLDKKQYNFDNIISNDIEYINILYTGCTEFEDSDKLLYEYLEKGYLLVDLVKTRQFSSLYLTKRLILIDKLEKIYYNECIERRKRDVKNN